MAYTKSSIELEYVFLGMKFNLDFLEGSFTDEEQQDIRFFVENMSKTIYIDKSYVECEGNRRKSVFMLESGWNALKDTILDSRFCRYSFNHSEEVLADAFATMGKCYMYECLSLKTDKFNQVNITVDPSCEFDVIVCKDIAHDYIKYIGPWQEWEFDNDGNFLSAHAKIEKDTNEVNNFDD